MFAPAELQSARVDTPSSLGSRVLGLSTRARHSPHILIPCKYPPQASGCGCWFCSKCQSWSLRSTWWCYQPPLPRSLPPPEAADHRAQGPKQTDCKEEKGTEQETERERDLKDIRFLKNGQDKVSCLGTPIEMIKGERNRTDGPKPGVLGSCREGEGAGGWGSCWPFWGACLGVFTWRRSQERFFLFGFVFFTVVIKVPICATWFSVSVFCLEKKKDFQKPGNILLAEGEEEAE